MRIRLMQLDDYEKIYRLWTGTSGMGIRSLDDSPEGIARFLSRNPATCFVAEADDDIIGVILSGHDGRRGYIYHTAVTPEHRRQGIGKALVEKVVTSMINEGINKLALVVFKNNESGNRFWKSLHFEERDDLIYRNISLNDRNC